MAEKLSFGRYTPGPVPADDLGLRNVVFQELSRLADAMILPVMEHMIAEQRQALPNKLYDGLVAYADGTNWAPTSFVQSVLIFQPTSFDFQSHFQIPIILPLFFHH